MILSRSTQHCQRIKCSKVSKLLDVFTGGWGNSLPIPPRSIDTPKIGDTPTSSRSGSIDRTSDPAFAGPKVDSVNGPGHSGGAKVPGEASQGSAHQLKEMDEYKAKQQEKWQIQRDAQMRDKLFGQPSAGRVDGREVEPFSSPKLEKNADELVKAKETAAPPANKTLLKTAAITTAISAPFSTLGLFIASTASEALKPSINPPPVYATERSVQDRRLVDYAEKNVFLIANTLATLRGEEHVRPSLKWLAQTDDERLDALEAMLVYAEDKFGEEAKKSGVSFHPASPGADQDEIKDRVAVIESRMAALTALMGKLKVKVPPTAV